MDNKLFLYFITDQMGNSARINSGLVEYLGMPKALPQTPDGWQEILIGWERNFSRYGNIRNFSLPLGFVLDGATILRDGLYRNNVDKKLYLLIHRRVTEIDDTYFKTYYKYLYKGELDLSTMKDEQGEPKVTINISEGGLQKQLDSKWSTSYFIPFDDDAVNVLLDGILLFKKAFFVSGGQIPISIYGRNHAPALSFINSEGSATGLAFFNQNPEPIGVVADYVNESANYPIINSGSSQIIINVKGRIAFTCVENDINAGYRMYYTKQSLSEVDILDTAGAMIEGGLYVFDIDVDIPLDPGDRLFILGFYTGAFAGGSIEANIEFTDETELEVNFSSKGEPTTIKAFRPYDLFKKLVEKITGSPSNAFSILLSNSTYYITSGDGLRGIEEAGVKTSISDFFKAFDIYLMAGIGIENGKIVIEERRHFFKTGSPVSLGHGRDLIISPAKDRMFTSIRIGHREQNVDDVNGKFDFNGWHIYTAPVESDNKELDLQSPYKAGPYEIEITRLNFEGKTTTDGQSDNDVFILDVEEVDLEETSVQVSFIAPSLMLIPNGLDFAPGSTFTVTGSVSNDGTYTVVGVASSFIGQWVSVLESVTDEADVAVGILITGGIVYRLRRDIIPDSGVPSPSTIFNVRLSPKRLLYIHGPWLRSCLAGFDTLELKLENYNRNIDLVAGGITEKDNVIISSLGEYIFLPWYFEFDTQYPTSLVDSLEADPNLSFETIWGENTIEGFLCNAGLAPNTLQEQTYKLLAAPSVDITKFIKLPVNG